jgi:hypothetical protein
MKTAPAKKRRNKLASKAAAKQYYFSDSRDYEKVVTAEHVFFKELVESRTSISSAGGIRDAQGAAHQFSQDISKGLNLIARFAVDDPRPKSNIQYTMILGTLLIPSDGQCFPLVTHFMALSTGAEIEVKVHLDYDFDPNAKEQKPSPHFQSGGRFKEAILGAFPSEDLKVKWDTDIDKPRFPALPMCTALFWHSAFMEFQETPEIKAILATARWKKLIKNAEARVLGPFLEDAQRLLELHATEGLINAFYMQIEK